MGRTLHRYILLQVLAPFIAGLALFTFVLLIARIMKLVEMVVNRGVPITDVLLLFSYILPAFLEVTVPMALLLGCLMAVGRLSADSETIALRASGLSLYQIALPVGAFAIIVFAASLLLSVYARPWGNTMLRAGIFDLARTRATAGLKEHVFNDEFDGLVIYVEEIEPPGTALKRILISDRRVPGQQHTVIARRGMLVADEAAQSVNLRLFEGVIFTSEPTSQAYDKTDFSAYDVSLDLRATVGDFEKRERDPSEIPVNELRSQIAALESEGKPALDRRTELARRFAIPFASLVFPLLGIPLGMQPVRAVRSRGLAVSLLVILVYYLLLTLGETLGRQGHVPIGIAVWMPNVVLGIVGAILFVRSAREVPWPGEARLRDWAASVRSQLSLARSSP